MLEMVINSNLCENGLKEIVKSSNDNESLIRKKQIMKEQVIQVIRKKETNQSKISQKVILSENT